MCASYIIKQKAKDQFRLVREVRVDLYDYFDRLIVPYTPSPVIVKSDGGIELTPMKFSMVPSWSKEPKVKFATHNARLESIDVKPTWKNVFVKRHCIVPLTHFIEPIYDGEHAGYMVSFSEQEGRLIYAAGVWDEWLNRTTGEVTQSFAIITHEPPQFIADIGHDRCPVFLSEDSAATWLNNEGSAAVDLKEFLLKNQQPPPFTVDRFRPMKSGWEKRK